jgi:diguanylate cyclase (GGDEF)-like protein
MRAVKDIFGHVGARLSRRDLVDFEHALKDAIRDFLPFKTYSLYFPQSLPRDAAYEDGGLKPTYLRDEGKLLLPLVLRDELLGYFVAKGVRLSAPKTAPRYLTALATSCLEKLLLYKASLTDSLTGLLHRQAFLDALGREIELIQSFLATDQAASMDEQLTSFSGCLGMVLLQPEGMERINEECGFGFGDRILARLGDILRDAAPEDAQPARVGDDAFAVLLPGAKPKALLQFAERLRELVKAESFHNELLDEPVRVAASLGAAVYPQDLTGPQLGRKPHETARLLFCKAQLALATAQDLGGDRCLAFCDLLRLGGRVLETLPMERVGVSPGRRIDAREGQRFLVWSPSAKDQGANGRAPYKGEIVLGEVREGSSVAEVLHLSDPAWPIEEGDRLTLIREEDSLAAASPPPAAHQPDMLTGLYGRKDLLPLLTTRRQRAERFCLCMLRVTSLPRERYVPLTRRMEAMASRTAELVQERLPRLAEDPEAFGARYSLNSLVYFLPEADPGELLAEVRELVGDAANQELDLAAGIAAHPFLTFHKSDALDNCRKALDHALLLPEPKVALFDSISLNISADRLFSAGDVYNAVEEYKLALLADETNTLARNSLGVALARLGKPEQAKRHFEAVTEQDPADLNALYNLGCTCQRLGENDRAREVFSALLARDPRHVFSLLRLGGLAEAAGDVEEARRCYEQARTLPGGEALTMRHLARLAIQCGDKEQGREMLHQALIHNHKDALCLHLLAELYLDSGEDPEIAETLARQSAALRPERQEYWGLLQRALEVQGKHEQAQELAARAGGP